MLLGVHTAYYFVLSIHRCIPIALGIFCSVSGFLTYVSQENGKQPSGEYFTGLYLAADDSTGIGCA